MTYRLVGRHGVLSKTLATTVAFLSVFAIAVASISSPADARKRSRKAAEPIRQTAGPLTIVISLKRQRINVYDNNGRVASSRISSGRPGNRTPTGVFSILQKRRRHYSNIYHGAAMPNMQRITWSGIAMHAGHLPGYPASHGCIRLPYSFSKKLFSMTEMGGRVIVAHNDYTPVSFSHAKLLKPLPPGDPDAVGDQFEEADSNSGTSNATRAGNMLLGVSPANASEKFGLPDGIKRTRAAVAAFREREIKRLEATVEKADEWHKDAGEKLKLANLKLKQAFKAQQVLLPETREIERRLKAAKSGVRTAQRNFRDLLLRAGSLSDDVELAAAGQEEDALEAEALRHIAERDLALADKAQFDKLVADRQAAIDAAKTRRDTLKERYATAQTALVGARKGLKQAKKAFERRQRPITVLLSKHSNKLYVRQGYDPVMQADIEFEQPDAPLGTHVFQATGYTPDGSDLTWRSVTAAKKYAKLRRSKRSRRSKRNRRKVIQPANPNWPAQTPANALSRVKIPPEVVEALAEHIKPGSTIIISDERKSYETGKHTDLIVTTR
ncbi:MAG: L,D-transpeptidase family protein [Alphaproteobacteria bacterium]|nr:L,D-transpeptidase family protein [Alphaproteobacteria bacterium]